MATLVLAAAGAFLGQSFGFFGLVAGRALGALAGAALDRSLFGSSSTVERGRLSDLSVQASSEGVPVPRAMAARGSPARSSGRRGSPRR
ncbi:hypothetical protein [Methylobrevis pamukkalensis]|uniref:Uncharacterized protein n=1 Tax=Methylobrevis pamukkalensis TaxID=1439726 RepID=A0A1E3HAD9_9HYPH|nr:hypothetical protein A6302_00187 [Methylobrevis pamukkalensis]